MDYQEAQRTAQDWVAECVVEIDQHGAKSTVHVGATIKTHDDVVSTIEIGGALIQTAVQSLGHHQFRPILIVTEKAERVHRVGIGHQHAYNPMGSGRPNFKKAVVNAITRASEIEDVVVGNRATKVRVISLQDHATAELKGQRIPPDFHVARCQDGSYTLHIGTMKCSLEQLKEMCRAAYK
jgi:hypothetical protein